MICLLNKLYELIHYDINSIKLNSNKLKFVFYFKLSSCSHKFSQNKEIIYKIVNLII